MNKTINTILTICLIVFGTLFIVTFGILIPTISRNFYFSQIEKLDVITTLNYYAPYSLGRFATVEDIKDAFNSVMDFIWKGKMFALDPSTPGGYLTGSLPLSNAAMLHFKDCIPLFWLNAVVLMVSFVILATLLVLRLLNIFKPRLPFGFSPLFLLGLITFTILMVIGIIIICIPNFDDLFELFHKIVFPGKENWQFNPSTDQIICVLKEEYFMNCAILIVSLIVGQAILATASGIVLKLISKKKPTF